MASRNDILADPLNDSMHAHVAAIEAQLHALEEAFAANDATGIESCVQSLQRSLADSLVAFRKAEHAGVDPLSADLRGRLALAQSRVQAQQLAVHRAAASIDRTLGVLFPTEPGNAAPTYGNLAQGPSAKALKNAYR